MKQYIARIDIIVTTEIKLLAPDEDIAFDELVSEAHKEEQHVFNMLRNTTDKVYDVRLNDDFDLDYIEDYKE